MFSRILNSISSFSLKYLYPMVFGTAFLLSLSYSFTAIDAHHTGGIIYRSIIAFAFIILFTPVLIVKRKSIDRWTFILCGIYITINTISIFVGPIFYKSFPSSLSVISSLATLLMTIFTLLLFLSIFQFGIDEGVFRITTLSIIALVAFMCIYTYIFEYMDIYNTITNVHGWNYDVTSIYMVKTEYGNYLLIGSFLSFIYFFRYKKSYMILTYIFFFINMFLSRSKTSILISLPLLLLFLFFVIKKELMKNKLPTIIVLASTTLIILLLFILTIAGVGFFETIRYYLSETIIHDGIVVIEDRLQKWSIAFENMNNPFAAILGYGERIGPQVIQGSGDNYYIFSLASGGAIRLLLYVLLIVYLMIKVLKNKFFSNRGKTVICLIQILILLAGITDVIGIVGFTYCSLMFGYIFMNCNNLLFQESKIGDVYNRN